MNRLAQFSILELLLLAPVCAVFMLLNLTPDAGEVEFHMYNNGYFNQYIRRGWPTAYQIETDWHDFHGYLSESEQMNLKTSFLAQSRPRITYPVAACVNLATLLAALAVVHSAVVLSSWLWKNRRVEVE